MFTCVRWSNTFTPYSVSASIATNLACGRTNLSLGATCTTIDETFSAEYIAEAQAKGTDKYISKDLTVDASTCLFPDKTWFAKNLNHDDWPEEFHNLAIDFFNSDGTLTVWDEATFEQYVEYDAEGEFGEVTDTSNSGWTKNKFAILAKFIRMIFDMIIAIFTK